LDNVLSDEFISLPDCIDVLMQRRDSEDALWQFPTVLIRLQLDRLFMSFVRRTKVSEEILR
jgi:hypothetical protein